MWGSIAQQIGGSHVVVTSIITNPTADPHLYESSAANAGAVAQADLVILNGAGYDTWLSQLVASTSRPRHDVLTVSHILHMAGAGANPHFWYDIPKIPTVAAAIAAALSSVDPRDAAAFHAGLRRFDMSLAPLDTAIAHIRNLDKGAPVAYTERLPAYLLAAAGLDNVSPIGFATSIEDGVDPSPADTAAMNALIIGHKIRVLLYNQQTVSSVTDHVRALATREGIAVVALTETLPHRYATYQSWQLAQITAIERALGR